MHNQRKKNHRKKKPIYEKQDLSRVIAARFIIADYLIVFHKPENRQEKTLQLSDMGLLR